MDSSTQVRSRASWLLAPGTKLALAFFAFVLIGLNDGAAGVLLPSIQGNYHIDKTAMAFVFLAGTCGYLLGSFNLGTLMGWLGNWVLLTSGVTLWILSMLLIGFAPSFPLLLLAFLGIGLSASIIDAGLNIYVASLPNNSAFLNYLHGFYGIGAWLGPLVASGFLALQLGWNHVYLVWGITAILLLLGVSVIFRDWRGEQSGGSRDGRGLTVAILRSRVVWIAAIFLLFYVGAEVSMGNWSYSLLTEDRHGGDLISGWIVSGYWLGLTLGRITLARVSLAIGEKRLIQYCLGGLFVGLAIFWFAPILWIAAIGFFITGFALGPMFPTTIAVMSQLVPGRLLTNAIGFMVSFGCLGGALFSSVAGTLGQRYGLWTLLPFAMCMAVILFLLWWRLQHQPTVAQEKQGEEERVTVDETV